MRKTMIVINWQEEIIISVHRNINDYVNGNLVIVMIIWFFLIDVNYYTPWLFLYILTVSLCLGGSLILFCNWIISSKLNNFMCHVCISVEIDKHCWCVYLEILLLFKSQGVCIINLMYLCVPLVIIIIIVWVMVMIIIK